MLSEAPAPESLVPACSPGPRGPLGGGTASTHRSHWCRRPGAPRCHCTGGRGLQGDSRGVRQGCAVGDAGPGGRRARGTPDVHRGSASGPAPPCPCSAGPRRPAGPPEWRSHVPYTGCPSPPLSGFHIHTPKCRATHSPIARSPGPTDSTPEGDEGPAGEASEATHYGLR